MKGQLITLEGIDGSGKSTAAKSIAGRLRELMPERRLVLTAEPTAGQVGLILREKLAEESGQEISAAQRMQELFLFMADHAQHLTYVATASIPVEPGQPTYTPLGWRKPCYLLADEYTDNLGELMEDEVWEKYGYGKDPRCASCTMHSGYEAGIIEESFTRPGSFLGLILSGLTAQRKYRQNGHFEQVDEPVYAIDLESIPEVSTSGDFIKLDSIDLLETNRKE